MKRIYLLFFLAVVIILGVGGWLFRVQGEDFRELTERELLGIAQLKAEQLAAWRKERLTDARRLMSRPLFQSMAGRFAATRSPEDREALLRYLEGLTFGDDFSDVLLSDLDGQVLLDLQGGTSALGTDARMALARAVADRAPVMTDLITSASYPQPHLKTLIPVFAADDAAAPVAVCVLVNDAAQHLYPMLANWPVPSETAEFVLVRVDGDELVFLIERAAHGVHALRHRVPLAGSGLPAARFARGDAGVVEDVDYRGEPVLSVHAHVPGTPWMLVAKIDIAEAFMQRRQESALVAVLLFGIVLGTVFAGLFAWQADRRRQYQVLYQAEHETARLARLYSLLSEGNRLIVRKPDQDHLFREICRIAVEHGGLRFAWVGLLQADGSVRVVARFGDDAGYIDAVRARIEAVDPHGAGPTGRAIRTGEPVVVNDFLGDPALAPWHDHARQAGVAASAAFPIRQNGPIIGTLNLYAGETGFFGARELNTLGEMADDIGFGLDNLLRETERVAMASALRESESLYSSVVNAMAEGVVVQDADGKIRTANPAALAIEGRREEEMLGRDSDDPAWGAIREDGSRFRGEDHPAMVTLRTGRPQQEVVMGILQPDGERRWISINAQPLVAEGASHPHGVVTTFHDITALKESEARLRASQEHFDELAANSRTMTWEVDLDGRFTWFSPVVPEVLGYAPEDLVGKLHFYDLHPEEGREELKRLALDVFASGRQFRGIENPMIARDGRVVWVSTSGVPIRDEAGAIVGYRGMDTDITERRAMEEALRIREAEFRAVFDGSPVAIYIHDAESGAIIRANRQAWISHGLPDEAALLGTDIWGDPPYSRAEALALIRRAAREGEQQVEWQSVRQDGSRFWQKVHLRHVDIGGVPRVVAISVDITERKHAEAQLRLRSASLEAAANAVVIADRRGTIEWVNPAFTRISGYNLEETIGKNPRDLVRSGEQDAEFYRALWRCILSGQVWSGELINQRKDGSRYAEEMTITPLRNEAGEISHFIAIKQDITERRLLEEEYRQAQRMESVGRLAGGVAHDFNNLLSVISGYAEISLEALEAGSPLERDIQQIKRAADRAANLTRQLLAFSRRQVMRPEVVSVNQIVADAEKMLRRLIGEDIEFSTILDPEIGRVLADPGQLEQVLMNLVVNARDALPKGGKITLSSEGVEVPGEQAGRHDPLPVGRCVRISVRDNGTGMDESLVARIFDPFFTTKEQGKGTGLGLAMVYGIMKQSQGAIRVESTPGEGTVFHLYLPCIADADPATSASSKPGALVTGSETILVVEDDDRLREMAVRILGRAGYCILAAPGGRDALDLLARQQAPIHLLLTDVVMPGMSGRDLADQVSALRPEIRILFMSGYTDDMLSVHGVLKPGIELIQKPFTPAELTQRIRHLLDQPRAVL